MPNPEILCFYHVDICAHQTGQLYIPDFFIRRIFPSGDPVFLDEGDVQAEGGGGGGDLAGVIGLDAADGDEGVAALGEGFGEEVLQFAGLVPAKGEGRVEVFAFGVYVYFAPEMGGEAGEGVDWGGAEGEGGSGDLEEERKKKPS